MGSVVSSCVLEVPCWSLLVAIVAISSFHGYRGSLHQTVMSPGLYSCLVVLWVADCGSSLIRQVGKWPCINSPAVSYK